MAFFENPYVPSGLSYDHDVKESIKLTFLFALILFFKKAVIMSGFFKDFFLYSTLFRVFLNHGTNYFVLGLGEGLPTLLPPGVSEDTTTTFKKRPSF